MTPESKNRNDVISIYGRDELSSSTSKLHSSFKSLYFLFFSDSVASQFTWILLNSYWTNITMPALDRNLPVKCTKCEKIVVKKHMARHKQSCDSGTLSCPKCPNFFTKKKEDLNYHLAKHHPPKGVLGRVPKFLFSSTTQEEKAWNFDKSWDQIEWKAQRSPRIRGARPEQRAIAAGT